MKVKNTAPWIAGLLLLLTPVITLRAAEADVIVYGATPGGFCAAIAAAREGASDILLEPTDHVGGLSTGGLSHCDSNQMRRETLLGLFDEWHRRVVKDYTDRGLAAPYNPALKDTAMATHRNGFESALRGTECGNWARSVLWGASSGRRVGRAYPGIAQFPVGGR